MNLITKEELHAQTKNMTIGQVIFKCEIIEFGTFPRVEKELIGFVLTSDVEEAKKAFIKAFEEDEEATLNNRYMVILPMIYAGKIKDNNNKFCHFRGNYYTAIINNFGKWQSYETFIQNL